MSGQRRRVSVLWGAVGTSVRGLVGGSRRRRVRAAVALSLPVAALIAVLVAPAPAFAQVVGTPVPVGFAPELPEAVAVDPVTGMVFVADLQSGTIEVISEASQSVVADINVGGPGYDPVALAADPVSGTVYVTELGPPSQVLVITEDPADPADDQVTATVTVPSGDEGFSGPEGVAILPGATPDTGTVYVTDGAGDFVSVISEATNTVTSVIPIPAENGSADSYPYGIAADPDTGLVYVADENDGYVSVISGSTLLGSFPLDAADPGENDPSAVAVDPDTGTVYVTVPAPSYPTYAEVYVVQENPSDPPDATVATAVTMLPFGGGGALYGVPESIGVNPNTSTVYVSNFEGSLEVISEDTADPAADTVNEQVALDPTYSDFDTVYALGVDTSTGNPWSGTVYVDSDQTDELYPVSFPQPVTPQTISFSAPATGTVGGSATLSATGGGSGNPVVFSLDSQSGAGVCSVSGDTVSYLAAGSCVIDANQAGSGGYSAAPQVTQTITVNAQLAVTTSSLPDGSVGTGYDQTLAASGGVAPYSWSVASGTLPPGLTLSASGEISGTPTSAGTYGFTAQVADSETPADTATQDLAISIDTGPTITSADSATFTVGTAGSFTVTTAGYPTASLSESGALPVGVTFADNGDGTATLAGTPAASSDGAYPITITAANGVTPAATQSFTVLVDAAPAITSADSATFTVGTAGSFTVTTTGYPTASLSEAGPLPAGVTFASNGDGTATLAGTPAPGSAGTYMVTISAANSAGTASQAFVLTVNGAGLAITSATSATATSGTAFSFTITATGTPTPTLTHAGALPAGVTFTDNGDGTATLAGTPGATAHGIYPITFTAKNSTGTTSQGFLLTVDETPAFSSSASLTETAGTAFTATIASTAFPTAQLTSGSLPSGVTFTDNGNGTGTLSGSSALAAGTYSVTITAGNAVGSTSQTITLTVKAAGKTEQVPAFSSAAAASATAGTPLSFTVTTAGSPTSYTTNVTRSGTLPAGVSFTNNGNGTATFSGTPTTAAGGSYPVTLTAKNTAGTTTQSFVLTVAAAPTITTAASATATAGLAFNFTVAATGAPTPAMTESGALPEGLTWVDNGNGTATLAGVPGAGQGGVYTLTLAATNSLGAPSQTFTLTVDQAPAITSAPSATAAAGQAFTFTFTATGYPLPSFSHSGSVPGLTFAAAGDGLATLSGTPKTAGTYTIVITVKNSTATATEDFTLTVT